MRITNQDIRQEAKTARVYLWEVADRLGVTDATFSRKLRKEFSTEEKEKILAIIHEIKEGR